MCSEVALDDGHTIDDCPRANEYKTAPAVKIARLAVDSKIKGNGIGSQLIDFAVSLSLEAILPVVGCRFLIVDSKRDSVGFYEKSGLTMLDTEKNRTADYPILFMDLHKLQSK